MSVSIYCYQIKYQAKQKHLLPFHDTNLFDKCKLKMSNKVKDINIKNHTYYFFDDIINIKDFDPNNINIDEKSYENILVYYTAYVAIEDSIYVKINSVNPLYLMLNKINEYFEEINGNKYLTLVSTDESKEKNKKV